MMARGFEHFNVDRENKRNKFNPKAQEWLSLGEFRIRNICKSLELAQAWYKKTTNKGRRDLQFQVGKKVWLNSKNNF